MLVEKMMGCYLKRWKETHGVLIRILSHASNTWQQEMS